MNGDANDEGEVLVTVRVVGNGFLVTGSALPGIEPKQWVARDKEQLCQVLRTIMASPPELKP